MAAIADGEPGPASNTHQSDFVGQQPGPPGSGLRDGSQEAQIVANASPNLGSDEPEEDSSDPESNGGGGQNSPPEHCKVIGGGRSGAEVTFDLEPPKVADAVLGWLGHSLGPAAARRCQFC